MTNKELSSYILHYVKNDKTRSAVMLTGEWGTGKSHYIKNELIPFLSEHGGYKCILVSLYGLTSVSDISKSIYLETRAKMLSTKSEGAATSKLAVTTILKGVSSFLGVDLSASEDTLQELYRSVDLTGRLVILEDVERTQIDLLELMGYVNNLTEQDGVKVLLVANEGEILRYEPENEDIGEAENANTLDLRPKSGEKVYTAEALEYLKTKEKTIGDTIIFYGNFEDAIKQIISSFANEYLGIYADDKRAKDLLQIMEELKNFNLRSFIYACQKTVDIYQELQGEYADDFLTCIFYGIVYYCMRLKMGEKMVWSGTSEFSTELGSEKYPLFRFCYDYIQHHVIRREKIPVADNTLKNLRLYDRNKTRNDSDLVVIWEYHRHPEKQLRAAVESVQKRLEDPEDISFYDYGALAANLLIIKHNYGIDVSNAKYHLVENLRGRGDEINPGMLFRIGLHRGDTPLQKEYDLLRAAMDEALEGEKFLPEFNYTPDEAEWFSKKFGEYGDYFDTRKLASLLNIPQMTKMFLACTPSQMDDIRGAFLRIYRPGNIGHYLSEDRDALIELRDGISVGMGTHELDCVQKLQCKWFIDNLDDAIKKLY